MIGIWEVTVRDPSGRVKQHGVHRNVILNEFKDYCLDVTFGGATPHENWYVALIGGTESSVIAADADLTYSGIFNQNSPPYNEEYVWYTAYGHPTNRIPLTPTISGAAMDNVSAGLKVVTLISGSINGQLVTSAAARNSGLTGDPSNIMASYVVFDPVYTVTRGDLYECRVRIEMA